MCIWNKPGTIVGAPEYIVFFMKILLTSPKKHFELSVNQQLITINFLCVCKKKRMRNKSRHSMFTAGAILVPNATRFGNENKYVL